MYRLRGLTLIPGLQQLHRDPAHSNAGQEHQRQKRAKGVLKPAATRLEGCGHERIICLSARPSQEFGMADSEGIKAGEGVINQSTVQDQATLRLRNTARASEHAFVRPPGACYDDR